MADDRVLKLYKSIKRRLKYWEAWEDDGKVAVHVGWLGYWGKQAKHAIAKRLPRSSDWRHRCGKPAMNGHCHGGDIGSGTINVFCCVVDPVLAVKTLELELRKAKLLDEVTIAYSTSDALGAKMKVGHPPGRQRFSILGGTRAVATKPVPVLSKAKSKVKQKSKKSNKSKKSKKSKR